MQIRKAKPGDAKDIAEVHTRSWQAVYRGQFPDEYLDNIDVDRRTQLWRKLAGKESDDLVVMEENGEIVGFLHLAESRDDDAPPLTEEVTSVYFLAERWRKGGGRQLMEWALERSRQRDAERVTLWVLDQNQRARQFYEAMGFVFDGSEKKGQLRGGFEFTEVRYRYAYTLR